MSTEPAPGPARDLGAMSGEMRPLRLAMVGGGQGSFIGPVHRMAAELDGHFRLVAGAFSRDLSRSLEAGRGFGVAADRAYADFEKMIAAEAGRADGAEVIAIVAPNAVHYPAAKAALAAGLHVICEKPATRTLAEALDIAEAVRASGRCFGLTYTYAGYPMVRAAREIVDRGEIGRVRKVVVEYAQGWLSTALEKAGNRQASWRADPGAAGLGGCIGDIGVHAFHMAEFVSGLRVERICPDLSSVVADRQLDDDCNVLLRFTGDVPGVLIASQISAGARNGLEVKVYGERGGVSWSHEAASQLTIDRLDGPSQTLHAAAPYLSDAVVRASRLPLGHPEGFIEAFANLYADFARAVRSGGRERGSIPDIADGLRSMMFVERAVAASRARSGWVSLESAEP